MSNDSLIIPNNHSYLTYLADGVGLDYSVHKPEKHTRITADPNL